MLAEEVDACGIALEIYSVQPSFAAAAAFKLSLSTFLKPS